MHSTFGHWAFLVGVAVAIITGLIPAFQSSTIIWVLIILGFIVGMLNITAREAKDFLIAFVALVVVVSVAYDVVSAVVLSAILSNILAFVLPAGFVVSLRVFWKIAQD